MEKGIPFSVFCASRLLSIDARAEVVFFYVAGVCSSLSFSLHVPCTQLA